MKGVSDLTHGRSILLVTRLYTGSLFSRSVREKVGKGIANKAYSILAKAKDLLSSPYIKVLG